MNYVLLKVIFLFSVMFWFFTNKFIIQENPWDFPGGTVVGTLPSNAGSVGSIPGERAKLPQAYTPKNHNIKENQYCNKFNKDLKKKRKTLKCICGYVITYKIVI